MSQSTCPICQKHAERIDRGLYDFLIKCPRCGNFIISDELDATYNESYAPRYLLSGAIRNLSEEGIKIKLTTENVSDIINSVRVPTSPHEIIDLFLT